MEGSSPAGEPASSHVRAGGLAIAMAGVMAAVLLGALDNTVVVTALPQIVKDLNAQSNAVPFVVSAYLIAQTIAMPVFGRLSDHYGRRRFFLLGLVVFIAGSMLSGTSQNLDELIAFRAVQGVGSGAFFPVGNAIIATLFSPAQRARLTGLLSSVFGIALVTGPLVGAYIVDTTTWRWVFYVNLPVGIASIALVVSSLGPVRGRGGEAGFDWPGAVLLSGWVAAIMYPLERVSNGASWSDPLTVALLAVGAGLFAAFLYQELRAAEPLIPVRFFRRAVIAAANAVSFLRGTVLITTTTYVSVLVAFALGGSSDIVRDALYFFLVPLIVGSAIGGTALPRVGYRPVTLAGMALMALGVLLESRASTQPPALQFVLGIVPSGILLPLMIAGFGVGLTFAATVLAVQYSLPPRDLGIASSLAQFMGNLGGAIGVSALTSFQQLRFHALAPSPCQSPSCAQGYALALQSALASSIESVFAAMTLVAIGAVVASLWVVGRLPRGPAGSASTAR